MIKEIILYISIIFLVIFSFYIIYNGVVYISCLSIEETPVWNKIVVACHFNDVMLSYQMSSIYSNTTTECLGYGVS
jgi:hypothetical protein